MTNYKAHRGDTFTINMTVSDSLGAAEDITDWFFWMTLKTSKTIVDGSASFQQQGSIVVPASGTVQFVIPAESTALLAGTYYYDLQYRDASENIKTIDSGVITFLKDVTITSDEPVA